VIIFRGYGMVYCRLHGCGMISHVLHTAHIDINIVGIMIIMIDRFLCLLDFSYQYLLCCEVFLLCYMICMIKAFPHVSCVCMLHVLDRNYSDRCVYVEYHREQA